MKNKNNYDFFLVQKNVQFIGTITIFYGLLQITIPDDTKAASNTYFETIIYSVSAVILYLAFTQLIVVLNKHYKYDRTDKLINVIKWVSIITNLIQVFINVTGMIVDEENLIATIILISVMLSMGISLTWMSIKFKKEKYFDSNLYKAYSLVIFLSGISFLSIILFDFAYLFLSVSMILLGLTLFSESKYFIK